MEDLRAFAEGLVPLVGRFGQGSFIGPAELQPASDEVWCHAEDFGPFNDTACLAVQGQQAVAASVAHLLGMRRPATVGFFVGAVDVDSVNRVFRGWSRSHIGQEVVERFVPAGTNGDTPATVVCKLAVVRVLAALLHSEVCAVLSTTELPVRGHSYDHLLAFQTSATLACTGFQGAMADDSGLAAVALAEQVPASLAIRSRRYSKNGPSTESLAGVKALPGFQPLIALKAPAALARLAPENRSADFSLCATVAATQKHTNGIALRRFTEHHPATKACTSGNANLTRHRRTSHSVVSGRGMFQHRRAHYFTMTSSRQAQAA